MKHSEKFISAHQPNPGGTPARSRSQNVSKSNIVPKPSWNSNSPQGKHKPKGKNQVNTVQAGDSVVPGPHHMTDSERYAYIRQVVHGVIDPRIVLREMHDSWSESGNYDDHIRQAIPPLPLENPEEQLLAGLNEKDKETATLAQVAAAINFAGKVYKQEQQKRHTTKVKERKAELSRFQVLQNEIKQLPKLTEGKQDYDSSDEDGPEVISSRAAGELAIIEGSPKAKYDLKRGAVGKQFVKEPYLEAVEGGVVASPKDLSERMYERKMKQLEKKDKEQLEEKDKIKLQQILAEITDYDHLDSLTLLESKATVNHLIQAFQAGIVEQRGTLEGELVEWSNVVEDGAVQERFHERMTNFQQQLTEAQQEVEGGPNAVQGQTETLDCTVKKMKELVAAWKGTVTKAKETASLVPVITRHTTGCNTVLTIKPTVGAYHELTRPYHGDHPAFVHAAIEARKTIALVGTQQPEHLASTHSAITNEGVMLSDPEHTGGGGSTTEEDNTTMSSPAHSPRSTNKDESTHAAIGVRNKLTVKGTTTKKKKKRKASNATVSSSSSFTPHIPFIHQLPEMDFDENTPHLDKIWFELLAKDGVTYYHGIPVTTMPSMLEGRVTESEQRIEDLSKQMDMKNDNIARVMTREEAATHKLRTLIYHLKEELARKEVEIVQAKIELHNAISGVGFTEFYGELTDELLPREVQLPDLVRNLREDFQQEADRTRERMRVLLKENAELKKGIEELKSQVQRSKDNANLENSRNQALHDELMNEIRDKEAVIDQRDAGIKEEHLLRGFAEARIKATEDRCAELQSQLDEHMKALQNMQVENDDMVSPEELQKQLASMEAKYKLELRQLQAEFNQEHTSHQHLKKAMTEKKELYLEMCRTLEDTKLDNSRKIGNLHNRIADLYLLVLNSFSNSVVSIGDALTVITDEDLHRVRSAGFQRLRRIVELFEEHLDIIVAKDWNHYSSDSAVVHQRINDLRRKMGGVLQTKFRQHGDESSMQELETEIAKLKQKNKEKAAVLENVENDKTRISDAVEYMQVWIADWSHSVRDLLFTNELRVLASKSFVPRDFHMYPTDTKVLVTTPKGKLTNLWNVIHQRMGMLLRGGGGGGRRGVNREGISDDGEISPFSEMLNPTSGLDDRRLHLQHALNVCKSWSEEVSNKLTKKMIKTVENLNLSGDTALHFQGLVLTETDIRREAGKLACTRVCNKLRHDYRMKNIKKSLFVAEQSVDETPAAGANTALMYTIGRAIELQYSDKVEKSYFRGFELEKQRYQNYQQLLNLYLELAPMINKANQQDQLHKKQSKNETDEYNPALNANPHFADNRRTPKKKAESKLPKTRPPIQTKRPTPSPAVDIGNNSSTDDNTSSRRNSEASEGETLLFATTPKSKADLSASARKSMEQVEAKLKANMKKSMTTELFEESEFENAEHKHIYKSATPMIAGAVVESLEIPTSTASETGASTGEMGTDAEIKAELSALGVQTDGMTTDELRRIRQSIATIAGFKTDNTQQQLAQQKRAGVGKRLWKQARNTVAAKAMFSGARRGEQLDMDALHIAGNQGPYQHGSGDTPQTTGSAATTGGGGGVVDRTTSGLATDRTTPKRGSTSKAGGSGGGRPDGLEGLIIGNNSNHSPSHSPRERRMTGSSPVRNFSTDKHDTSASSLLASVYSTESGSPSVSPQGSLLVSKSLHNRPESAESNTSDVLPVVGNLARIPKSALTRHHSTIRLKRPQSIYQIQANAALNFDDDDSGGGYMAHQPGIYLASVLPPVKGIKAHQIASIMKAGKAAEEKIVQLMTISKGAENKELPNLNDEHTAVVQMLRMRISVLENQMREMVQSKAAWLKNMRTKVSMHTTTFEAATASLATEGEDQEVTTTDEENTTTGSGNTKARAELQRQRRTRSLASTVNLAEASGLAPFAQHIPPHIKKAVKKVEKEQRELSKLEAVLQGSMLEVGGNGRPSSGQSLEIPKSPGQTSASGSDAEDDFFSPTFGMAVKISSETQTDKVKSKDRCIQVNIEREEQDDYFSKIAKQLKLSGGGAKPNSTTSHNNNNNSIHTLIPNKQAEASAHASTALLYNTPKRDPQPFTRSTVSRETNGISSLPSAATSLVSPTASECASRPYTPLSLPSSSPSHSSPHTSTFTPEQVEVHPRLEPQSTSIVVPAAAAVYAADQERGSSPDDGSRRGAVPNLRLIHPTTARKTNQGTGGVNVIMDNYEAIPYEELSPYSPHHEVDENEPESYIHRSTHQYHQSQLKERQKEFHSTLKGIFKDMISNRMESFLPRALQNAVVLSSSHPRDNNPPTTTSLQMLHKKGARLLGLHQTMDSAKHEDNNNKHSGVSEDMIQVCKLHPAEQKHIKSSKKAVATGNRSDMRTVATTTAAAGGGTTTTDTTNQHESWREKLAKAKTKRQQHSATKGKNAPSRPLPTAHIPEDGPTIEDHFDPIYVLILEHLANEARGFLSITPPIGATQSEIPMVQQLPQHTLPHTNRYNAETPDDLISSVYNSNLSLRQRDFARQTCEQLLPPLNNIAQPPTCQTDAAGTIDRSSTPIHDKLSASLSATRMASLEASVLESITNSTPTTAHSPKEVASRALHQVNVAASVSAVLLQK